MALSGRVCSTARNPRRPGLPRTGITRPMRQETAVLTRSTKSGDRHEATCLCSGCACCRWRGISGTGMGRAGTTRCVFREARVYVLRRGLRISGNILKSIHPSVSIRSLRYALRWICFFQSRVARRRNCRVRSIFRIDRCDREMWAINASLALKRKIRCMKRCQGIP